MHSHAPVPPFGFRDPVGFGENRLNPPRLAGFSADLLAGPHLKINPSNENSSKSAASLRHRCGIPAATLPHPCGTPASSRLLRETLDRVPKIRWIRRFRLDRERFFNIPIAQRISPYLVRPERRPDRPFRRRECARRLCFDLRDSQGNPAVCRLFIKYLQFV